MSCELPVIATNVGVFLRQLKMDIRLNNRTKRFEELAEKIVYLLENEDLRKIGKKNVGTDN